MGKKWKPFFFDGNQAFGPIGTEDEFKRIVAAYPNALDAKMASYDQRKHDEGRLGEAWPSFGFRIEHTGSKTLGEWMKED